MSQKCDRSKKYDVTSVDRKAVRKDKAAVKAILAEINQKHQYQIIVWALTPFDERSSEILWMVDEYYKTAFLHENLMCPFGIKWVIFMEVLVDRKVGEVH
jgi:hypothetical protein